MDTRKPGCRAMIIFALMAFAAFPSTGLAWINGTLQITADDAYAFGFGDATGVSGVWQSADNCNFDDIYRCTSPFGPETYSVNFQTDDYLYIAAWSNDDGGQGLMAELTYGPHKLVTGPDGWEVFSTGQDLDNCDGVSGPSITDVNNWVAYANTNNAWVGTTPKNNTALATTSNNGLYPMSCMPDSGWIWYNPYVDKITDPFTHDPFPANPRPEDSEYLIFRVRVDCVGISNEEILCPTDDHYRFSYCFDITNNSDTEVHYVLLPEEATTPGNGRVKISPNVIKLDRPLPPGCTTRVCTTIEGAEPGEEICFLINLADKDIAVCCASEICITLPDCDCLQISDDYIRCSWLYNGDVLYVFDLDNLSGQNISHIFLSSDNGTIFEPDYFDVSTLSNWQTTTLGTVIKNPGSGSICFKISAHNENMEFCCSEEVCIDLPRCPIIDVPTDGTGVDNPRFFDYNVVNDIFTGNYKPWQSAIDAANRFRARVPDFQATYSPVSGALHTASAGNGFLTEATEGELVDIAGEFVSDNLDLLGLKPRDVAEMQPKDMVLCETSGLYRMIWQQTHDGLLAYGALLDVNLSEDGRIASLKSDFMPGLAVGANMRKPTVTAARAVMAALETLEISLESEPAISGASEGPAQRTVIDGGGISREDIIAALMYLPIHPQKSILAWRFDIHMLNSPSIFEFTIDARTGLMLTRTDRSKQHKHEECVAIGDSGAPASKRDVFGDSEN